MSVAATLAFLALHLGPSVFSRGRAVLLSVAWLCVALEDATLWGIFLRQE